MPFRNYNIEKHLYLCYRNRGKFKYAQKKSCSETVEIGSKKNLKKFSIHKCSPPPPHPVTEKMGAQ